MAIITATVKAQRYIENYGFFFSLIENRLDDEVIFQDENSSFHRAKSSKGFRQEGHIN